MTLFSLILRQTVSHAFRKGGGAFGTLAFYVIVATLFTFALGAEGMSRYAGAVMSVAMLLAIVTALPMFYELDYEDGMLEQFLLQPIALEWLAAARIIGQWAAIALPILIISPLIAVMADLSRADTLYIMLQLLLASPTLVAIGSVAAALTLGARRGGLLQSLVMLPLAIPVLIFAASSGGQGTMLFLSAMLCAALPLSCLVSAALIRASQE
jgi:heme exporter protein B